MPGPVRLLVFFARLGDLVLLSPLLRALHAGGGVELCARPWARGILAGQDWMGGIHCLTRPNASFPSELIRGMPRSRLAGRLAGRPFHEILFFAGERRCVRQWLDAWRGSIPIRVLDLPDPVQVPHMADAFLAAGRAAGLVPDGFPALPRLDVPAVAEARARIRVGRLGSKVIAFQAGSSLTDRWFRRRLNLKGIAPWHWADLAAQLLQDGSADAITLMGTAAERSEAQAIIAACPARLRPQLHDWTGQVPLDQLPAVMRVHRGLVSVDTGPAHVAAAAGCPVLAFFGPSYAARYAPRGPAPIEVISGEAPCRPCLGTQAFRRCRGNRCLAGLDAVALHRAWGRLEDRIAAARRPVPASDLVPVS